MKNRETSGPKEAASQELIGLLEREAGMADSLVVDANEDLRLGGEEASYAIKCREIVEALKKGDLTKAKEFVGSMLKRYEKAKELTDENKKDHQNFEKMRSLLESLEN